jgi:hypothetical protein
LIYKWLLRFTILKGRVGVCLLKEKAVEDQKEEREKVRWCSVIAVVNRFHVIRQNVFLAGFQ